LRRPWMPQYADLPGELDQELMEADVEIRGN